jgi:hypothetical protein
VGAADHELAGGIHVQEQAVVKESLQALGKRGHHAGKQHIPYVAAYSGEHFLIGLPYSLRGIGLGLHEVVVLGGDYNRMHTEGSAVVVILHGHLALGVRTQIRDGTSFTDICHLLAFAANLGQLLHEAVCQFKRQRHIAVGLVGGIAEHHSLVTCALFLVGGAFHALAYVGTLLVDGAEYAAAVGVEAVSAPVIADAVYHLAHHSGDVHVCLALHLAGHHYLAGGTERLDSHLAGRVAGQEVVQQRIADLVGHLVGVTFTYGFGCE